uniref:DB domain-containing protein n=1 Tax=Parastrongyloides trichosuri TaxID=131310 RepID=A0A0N4ZN31_PARTI
MLPEPQSPRTALALSDLQSASSSSGGFGVGGGGISGLSLSNNNGGWSTRGVGGIGAGLFDKGSSSSTNAGAGAGIFGSDSNQKMISQNSIILYLLLSALYFFSPLYGKSDKLPPCDSIPKLLCCTERVLEKCLGGCINYVHAKCPHKLYKFEKIANQDKSETNDKSIEAIPTPELSSHNKNSKEVKPKLFGESSKIIKAPIEQEQLSVPKQVVLSAPSFVPKTVGDYANLNPKYPVTEVSDKDLSPECGTEQSQPPFSPCISRKTVDELFRSCCEQHVPSNCHSLCSYEHREHVAAETLIQAVQQEGCDLKYMTKILYCANQNRDNRKCCSSLGLDSTDLGVGSRCLRMCNISPSGDSLSVLTEKDLVCLSNLNIVNYCARAGIRTLA